MAATDDPRALAINVGANTTLPGFRAPIRPDGSFEYIPIPEREPTRPDASVPTYGDLDLSTPVPEDLLDRRVHLDPEFAGVHGATRYTYGDEHAVKAGPITELDVGDYLFFYSTLEPTDAGTDEYPDWVAPDWGAYLIGGFCLERAPMTGAAYDDLPSGERDRLSSNAHCKRETVDARVFVVGDPGGSALYDRAIPLSTPTAGSDPNRVVTEWSEDSGKGPWWRRPMRFSPTAAARLLDVVAEGCVEACFED